MTAKKTPAKKRQSARGNNEFPTSKQTVVLWIALIMLAAYTLYVGVFKPTKSSEQDRADHQTTSVVKPKFDFYQSLPKAQVTVTQPATPLPTAKASAAPVVVEPAPHTTPPPVTMPKSSAPAATTHSKSTPQQTTVSSSAKIQQAKPTAVARSRSPVYVLQVASFKQEADADALKAKLSLLGFEVDLHPFKADNGQHWYRVWVGDFDSKAEAKTIQAQLTENHITSLLRTKI